MNDQRQVIFAQRLKILKENNIKDILDNFFEEILKNLEEKVNSFKKSNDEKYLTEIKNITGNSLNDQELIRLTSKNKDTFNNNMREIFKKKEKSREEILGNEQNNILEKKIFLQIIDFSWRAHLQYLEQLRQVIGLRQYGQKDPLSEFKKEAFILFEGLLFKIKNDLIKLMLNLKIEISSNQTTSNELVEKKEKNNYKKVGRNDKCPCGSGKKFKYCHGNI